MNEYREDKTCYFHPMEVVVGVCALCLNERLLILAEKQNHQLRQQRSNDDRNDIFTNRKPSINQLPKVFALGSLLNHLDIQQRKSDDYDGDASTSQEDSFISIKFEDNGVASWEKGTVPKVSLEHCDNMSWNNQDKYCKKESQGVKCVVEHAKPRNSSLRWRKRIGHLLQFIRWKRSSKSNVCHVSNSKLEGVKVRHGWIRTLKKRSTTTKE